jgi:hypothetical protein
MLVAIAVCLVHSGLSIAPSSAQSLVAPQNRTHLDQIYDAFELVLGAYGQLNRYRAAFQTADDRFERVVEVRSHAIHLVDEADAGNIVLIGLPPNRFGLRLHSGHCVEHRHRAIQHAQAAFYLGGKINVSRSVNDVDLDIAPFAGGSGRCNRNAALLLLLHPVHRGRAFVDFAELMRTPRVIQDPLCSGGFTGIDMSGDADISHPFERYRSCHKS